MAVHCTKCGTGLPAEARFCSTCGAAAPPAAYAAGRPPFSPVPVRPVLIRPIVGRRIAGVCIGLAQAYGWDLALVRVLAVVGLICSGGIVFVAYLAFWIGIPEEPVTMPNAYSPPPTA